MLSTLGQTTVGDDHWSERQSEQKTVDQSQEGCLTGATGNDLSVSTSFKTSPSSIQPRQSPLLSSTRVYSTVIKIQTSTSNSEATADLFKPVPRSELVSTLGKLFVTPAVASRLLNSWVKHLSAQYPVIHTLRLQELHTRRDDGLDVYEESMLHLVYANSGCILEAVSDLRKY